MDVALRCVQESGADRSTMGHEVVKEIENNMQWAGLNTNIPESSSASASYEESSLGTSSHPYDSDPSFNNSVSYLSSKIELCNASILCGTCYVCWPQGRVHL